MNNIIKFFKDIYASDPTLAIVLLIFLIIFFKTEIKEYIRVKFFKKESLDKKLEKKVINAVSDLRYIREFHKDVVAISSDMFSKEILDIINQSRVEGRKLILDLSKVQKINEQTREAFRDSLIDTINKDNVQLKIIFPKENCTKLFDEINKYAGKRGSSCVVVKRDGRTDRNMVIKGEQ